MTNAYGLIGYPLAHSFSPGYFRRKFAAEGIAADYDLYPIQSVDEFPALLASHPGFIGLNVTIPYKETIIPFLDKMDETARAIGAVNCIAFMGGQTKGYNTDVIGFEKSLLPLLKPRHKHALVLGDGGAAKAVKYVLAKLNIRFTIVTRAGGRGTISYGQLNEEIIKDHKLIINTTPVGMYPEVNTAPPIPYGAIGGAHLLYDLVYNPAETLFLKKGKVGGAIIENGLQMLELQAEAAWEIWSKHG